MLPPQASDREYMVLPTRRRAGSGTTAVDIRMDHGDPVLSVVTGHVLRVADYALYGRFPDQLVEIVPHDSPYQVVRVLHVEGAQVAEGQHVVAGETVLAATARQLPFRSQIDRYKDRGPHVHVEVHDMNFGR